MSRSRFVTVLVLIVLAHTVPPALELAGLLDTLQAIALYFVILLAALAIAHR